MKRILLALTLALPLAAVAAPPGAPPGPGDMDQRREQMQKRMRLARLLGLAEALDLSDQEALKLRDALARIDQKREPLRKQAREALEVLRKSAQGDAAADKGVDEALRKLREVRGQMMALHDEAFQAVAKDLPPQKKAKAALFLARFRRHMGQKAGEAQVRIRELRMRGPMDGHGPMGGPGGAPMQRNGPSGAAPMDPGLPPLAELSDEEPFGGDEDPY